MVVFFRLHGAVRLQPAACITEEKKVPWSNVLDFRLLSSVWRSG